MEQLERNVVNLRGANDIELEEEYAIRLAQKGRPNGVDHYFFIMSKTHEPFRVRIIHRRTWHTFGPEIDHAFAPHHYVPLGFQITCEGCWIYEGSEHEALTILNAHGFTRRTSFFRCEIPMAATIAEQQWQFTLSCVQKKLADRLYIYYTHDKTPHGPFADMTAFRHWLDTILLADIEYRAFMTGTYHRHIDLWDRATLVDLPEFPSDFKPDRYFGAVEFP